jgi:hypothetical protein
MKLNPRAAVTAIQPTMGRCYRSSIIFLTTNPTLRRLMAPSRGANHWSWLPPFSNWSNVRNEYGFKKTVVFVMIFDSPGLILFLRLSSTLHIDNALWGALVVEG